MEFTRKLKLKNEVNNKTKNSFTIYTRHSSAGKTTDKEIYQSVRTSDIPLAYAG